MIDLSKIHELQNKAIIYNESDITQQVVIPTLHELGHTINTIYSKYGLGTNNVYAKDHDPYYDPLNMDEVNYFPMEGGFVNLAIQTQKDDIFPRRIIEVIPTDVPIQEHYSQIVGHLEIAMSSLISWEICEVLGVITNGYEYHFFHNFDFFGEEKVSNIPVFIFDTRSETVLSKDTYKNRQKIFEHLLGPESTIEEIKHFAFTQEQLDITKIKTVHALNSTDFDKYSDDKYQSWVRYIYIAAPVISMALNDICKLSTREGSMFDLNWSMGNLFYKKRDLAQTNVIAWPRVRYLK